MPRKKAVDTTVAQQPDFETAIAELEALVQRMERGELSLDDSLHVFERGVQFTRFCQAALKTAEQRVKLLSATGLETDFPPVGDA